MFLCLRSTLRADRDLGFWAAVLIGYYSSVRKSNLVPKTAKAYEPSKILLLLGYERHQHLFPAAPSSPAFLHFRAWGFGYTHHALKSYYEITQSFEYRWAQGLQPLWS
ncbi:hypothetical protein P5673_033183 [Acropora cervicornis]|uniref:Uncharacterized protein n=1 Tax=Acropora cervicornis TaxID=6130 RepID=A0AAD9PQC0_ACRCE|nr:hypothetical protein P5673_033183 [Acropora cervicornis]